MNAVPDEAAPAIREAAFDAWWSGVWDVLPAGKDAAHEAFCAGWETSAPHIAAAERERIRQLCGDGSDAKRRLGELLDEDEVIDVLLIIADLIGETP